MRPAVSRTAHRAPRVLLGEPAVARGRHDRYETTRAIRMSRRYDLRDHAAHGCANYMRASQGKLVHQAESVRSFVGAGTAGSELAKVRVLQGFGRCAPDAGGCP